MNKSTNNLLWLGIGLGAYYAYNHLLTQTTPQIAPISPQPPVSTATGGGQSLASNGTCTYPDGTAIPVPQGNLCPYDASHGGQSTPSAAAVSPTPAIHPQSAGVIIQPGSPWPGQ